MDRTGDAVILLKKISGDWDDDELDKNLYSCWYINKYFRKLFEIWYYNLDNKWGLLTFIIVKD